MMKLPAFKHLPAYLKLRLSLGLVFFVIIGVFVYLSVVPFGKISYSKNWSRDLSFGGGFIDNFKPGDRLDLTENQSLKIIAEPIYFSLFTPRQFDKAKVKIVYEDKLTKETPIVEIGLLKDKAAGAYEFRSVQNKNIDSLRFSWHRLIDDENFIVLQRDDAYQNEDSFLKDLSDKKLKTCQTNSLSCVAFYNYPIGPSFSLPSYTELYPLNLNQDLLGNHKLYVYFNNKPGKLKIDFLPYNNSKTQKDLQAELRVYQDGVLIETKKSEVPGSIIFSSSVAALYKMEIVIGDEVVIDKIESSSDRLVFLNKLYPIEITSQNTIFTNAKTVYATTLETEALGNINFSDYEFDLNKTHSQIVLKSKDVKTIQKIKEAKGGIMFSGDGVFSFNETKIFDPETRQMSASFESDNYQYLVANYKSPLSRGSLKEANLEFSLSGADYKDDKYSFVISIPGLNQDKGYDSNLKVENYLAIKEISIEMEGKTLWQKIKELYAN